MENCVFCRIVRGELAAEKIDESQNVLVFPDINPSAPVHYLIIPKKHMTEFSSLRGEEKNILWEMFETAGKLIKEKNLKGYRLVINGGRAAMIDHLHLHLLAGITKERKV